MKNKTLLVLVSVLVILGAGIYIGYRMWNKPPEQVEDVRSIQVTAAELCKAYADNEAKANELYLNKALEVTGAVSAVNQNQDGYTLVTLQGEDATAEVACTMRDKKATPAVGSNVTVKGFCSGTDLFGVKLTDCIIVK